MRQRCCRQVHARTTREHDGCACPSHIILFPSFFFLLFPLLRRRAHCICLEAIMNRGYVDVLSLAVITRAESAAVNTTNVRCGTSSAMRAPSAAAQTRLRGAALAQCPAAHAARDAAPLLCLLPRRGPRAPSGTALRHARRAASPVPRQHQRRPAAPPRSAGSGAAPTAASEVPAMPRAGCALSLRAAASHCRQPTATTRRAGPCAPGATAAAAAAAHARLPQPALARSPPRGTQAVAATTATRAAPPPAHHPHHLRAMQAARPQLQRR